MNFKGNVMLTSFGVVLLTQVLNIIPLNAQETKDTVKKSEFKPSGKIWGYVFGDYAFKAHSDSSGLGRKPSALVQYTGLAKDYNSFNLRRIYLAYDYNVSEKFSTSILLAHESGIESNTTTDPALTSDSKRGMYIKYANLAWKNIIPRGNLIIGQQATPTCATLAEKIWAYRSVEKTITDMRSPLTGSSTTDLGAGLFGKFDKNENFGYELLIGNGNGSKLENNSFKKIYTSLYAWLWNKKIVVQANYDFDRTQLSPYHTSRVMMKAFAAYQTDPITIGVEAYMQTFENANISLAEGASVKDTTNALSAGVSVFIRGNIIKDKLNFFARYDMLNPDSKFDKSRTYTTGGTVNGTNVTENFVTAGLDFTPQKNIHIMPNIWYNDYTNRALLNISTKTDFTGAKKRDYDFVVRVTFYYLFR